jgi:Ran GTPase-activating protein (RanGAP) involved in mRNA processing and transport
MTITLTTVNPKIREVIDDAKATELIATWKEQLGNETSVSCEKIVLDGKSYTPGAAKIIADFLTSTEDYQPSIASGIKVAILSDIIASQMEDQALIVLKTISDAFKESQLVEVDLSDNAMGTKGVVACETVLSGPSVMDTLQRLKLCNNGLSKYTMEEVAVLLTKGDASCIAKNLTQIHFFNNMSDDDGCESFKKIIARAEHLEDIRFSGTRAKAKGSAFIASGLGDLAKDGNLSDIVRLDLADNSFGDCYEDLAEALRSCTKLEYLDLHDCCLGDDGIVAVCDVLLEAKPPLSFVSLSGNDVGEDSYEGGKSIAALIKSINKSLVSFNASENELKSPGIRSIARAFTSDAVKEIFLNQNECGTVGANEIMKMASRVPNLEVIQLDANGFTPDIVEKLEEVFGDKLGEMDDNIDDEDYDDDLDPEDLKDDAGDDAEEEDAKESPDADVDALAADFSKLGSA